YLLPCRYPHIFLEKNEDEIRSLTVEEELPQKYENDKRLIFPACMPRNPISEADRMQLYRYTGELNSIKGHYTEELGNITEFDISELWGVNCRVFYVGSIDVARVDGIEAVGMPIGLFHKDIAADEYEPVILAAKVTIKTDNEAL
ncbi:MAG: hypothetical protein IJL87_08455, partial [Clostridia bacterium]|nr:hypothetical protein [Clostridia bacterium]